MEVAVTGPVVGCTLAVLIVAIVSLVRIRDREAEVHWRLHHEEIEHERRLHQLEMERLRLAQSN